MVSGRDREKEKKFIKMIRYVDNTGFEQSGLGKSGKSEMLCKADGYRCPYCKIDRFYMTENSWGIRLRCSSCGYEDSNTGFRE